MRVCACARKMNHAMMLCVHMLTREVPVSSNLSSLIENVEKPSHTKAFKQHCATFFNCPLDIWLPMGYGDHIAGGQTGTPPGSLFTSESPSKPPTRS